MSALILSIIVFIAKIAIFLLVDFIAFCYWAYYFLHKVNITFMNEHREMFDVNFGDFFVKILKGESVDLNDYTNKK